MSNVFSKRTGFELNRAYPVGSGVLIEPGDLLKLSGGKVTAMTAASDNLTFIGKAVEAHQATLGSGEITVSLANGNVIFEYDLDAATDIAVNDELQWATKQSLKKSATDPIAVAVESKLQATSIRCVLKIPALLVGDAS
jgi:hypothetical protein